MKSGMLFLVIAVGLVSAGHSGGSPLAGKRALEEHAQVPARSQGIIRVTFRGGERACVMVKGSSKNGEIGLSVFDQKGNLITEDKGGGNVVAVIWYPPRDATYRIEIANNGDTEENCYVSFK